MRTKSVILALGLLSVSNIFPAAASSSIKISDYDRVLRPLNFALLRAPRTLSLTDSHIANNELKLATPAQIKFPGFTLQRSKAKGRLRLELFFNSDGLLKIDTKREPDLSATATWINNKKNIELRQLIDNKLVLVDFRTLNPGESFEIKLHQQDSIIIYHDKDDEVLNVDVTAQPLFAHDDEIMDENSGSDYSADSELSDSELKRYYDKPRGSFAPRLPKQKFEPIPKKLLKNYELSSGDLADIDSTSGSDSDLGQEFRLTPDSASAHAEHLVGRGFSPFGLPAHYSPSPMPAGPSQLATPSPMAGGPSYTASPIMRHGSPMHQGFARMRPPQHALHPIPTANPSIVIHPSGAILQFTHRPGTPHQKTKWYLH